MTDFKRDFDGCNACMVSADGVQPLAFQQIPEGHFAIILDDMAAEIMFRLPRPADENGDSNGHWLCELNVAYGDVIKADTMCSPEVKPEQREEHSGVHATQSAFEAAITAKLAALRAEREKVPQNKLWEVDRINRAIIALKEIVAEVGKRNAA